jgi:YHS domain-containing protein
MKLFLLTAFTFFSAANFAQTGNQYNLEKGLAIQGYDPVAYFTKQKAVKGNAAYSYTYNGAKYLFASAENKNAFAQQPTKYEPQYGGWCAYAMGATGEKVEIDPETFKITNGKLFLFYHSWVNNTLTKWEKDEKNLNQKADANWKKFIK